MKIRVSTGQLRAAAKDAAGCIDTVSMHFDNIEELVRTSSTYWSGEGQEAYLQSYIARIERIQQALAGFRDNIGDLEQIAGIYEAAEKEVAQSTEPLSSNVII